MGADAMIAFNSLMILIAAFIAVFLQSAMNGFLGVQLDVLPALMVYAGLTAGPLTVATLALCGGVLFGPVFAESPCLGVPPPLSRRLRVPHTPPLHLPDPTLPHN